MPEIAKSFGVTVKTARESLNISIRELARRSSLSATSIWKIEKGKMVPSIVVLVQIARGLRMKLTELLDPVLEEEAVVATMKDSRYSGSANDSRDVVERISGSSRSWIIQAAEHTFKKGARSSRQPMIHSGEELVYCLHGQVQYIIDGKTYDLREGDTLHFKSEHPHLWRNIAKGDSRILLVVIPPRLSSHYQNQEHDISSYR